MRRLSPAFLTIIMLGVVALLVAMYFGKKLLATAEPVVDDPLLNIPMALSDLKPGTEITEAHLGLGKARTSKMTRDVVRTNRVLVGRVVKNTIRAAEPISTLDLYPPGEHPPLEVGEGMRAVTVPLGSNTSIVDGLVDPGQFVDVHFTPNSYPTLTETGGMTMTMFKGVKVIAINGRSANAQASSRGGNSVTLELSPEQSNIILLAQNKGELNLTYTPEGRGTGVVAVDDEDRAFFNQILGIEQPEEESIGPPFVTEIFSGTGRRVQTFRDGMRSDRYAIDHYDYHRGRGRYGRYGGYGVGDRPPAVPDFESYGSGGYLSVPSGAAQGPGNNNAPANNQRPGNSPATNGAGRGEGSGPAPFST